MIKVKKKRVSPRGSRLVDCKERMNEMRARTGYLYLVMAQSSDLPMGERLQIAVFALESIDQREELRSGGFSE